MSECRQMPEQRWYRGVIRPFLRAFFYDWSEDMLKRTITIKDLQRHIKAVDFAPDKLHEVVLKLFEEVGELSVEMRKAHEQGATETVKRAIKYELYDVLHYVTYIANIYEIDLEDAIIEKDRINAERYHEIRGGNND